jgi:hypothetical protein
VADALGGTLGALLGAWITPRRGAGAGTAEGGRA